MLDNGLAKTSSLHSSLMYGDSLSQRRKTIQEGALSLHGARVTRSCGICTQSSTSSKLEFPAPCQGQNAKAGSITNVQRGYDPVEIIACLRSTRLTPLAEKRDRLRMDLRPNMLLMVSFTALTSPFL
jgi:hypothetical protein